MHRSFSKNRLASFSIRRKLFLLRIGIGLCMGLIIGAASVWIATMVLYGFVENDLSTSARLMSGQVRLAVGNAGHELAEMAESPDMEKYFHSGRNAVLANLLRQYAPHFDHIVYFTPQGEARYAMLNGRMSEDPAPEKMPEGLRTALDTPNTLVTEGVVFDPALHKPVVRYYYNHIDYFDNHMGVVAASVSLEALADFLEMVLSEDEHLGVMVADNKGQIVFGPVKEDFGRPGPAFVHAVSTVSPQKGPGQYLGKHEAYGNPSLVTGCPIDEFGWRVFVITPASLIDRPLYALFTLVFLVTAATMVCGEVISRRLGIRILEPIERLIRVISDILESGNLTQRVAWASQDEMGTLAGLFNAMLEKIDTEQIELQEQRTRELEQEVSKRKKDQARLRQALVDAQAATLAKSEFLANMSHEIRTPMNGIMGMAELALDTDLDTDQEYLISTISSEAESLLSIINSILDFSKIEAGKLELEVIPFDPREWFENLAATFAVTAREKGLEFISFLPPDLPERLIGDPGRLRQVMVNLVGNAVKFTPKGEVYMAMDRVEVQEGRVEIRFSIEDTGIGIPEDQRSIIFDSFSQADGSTTRKYGGTGLGTTISKQLVEMMGGDIGFENRPEGGTRFWFTALFENAHAATEELEVLPWKLNILVADDSPRTCSVVSRYLEILGCNPFQACDAGTAMKILFGQASKAPPMDMVLVDREMPGTGGRDLAEQIRTMGAEIKVPVILLRSAWSAGSLPEAASGVAGCIAKPVGLADLRAAVSSVMENTPQARPGTPLPETPAGQTGRTRDIQILLAEDYPTNQQIAVKHLTASGFNVKLAEDGRQALALFRQDRFDLILMDIQMPGLDGYEAAQLIRKEEGEGARVPIIAMTAHAVAGYREKCLESGMDDYLTKPLKRRDLVCMVEKWTGRDSSDADGQHRTPPDSAFREDIDGAPVDMIQAMDEFENDRPFFLRVFTTFQASLKNRMEILESAVQNRDFKTIREQAHTIKGGAANVAAMPLYAAAKALEACGENGNPGVPEKKLSRLRSEVERLMAFGRVL